MKTTDANALPNDIEALKNMVLDMQSQLQTEQAEKLRLQQQLDYLREQWQLLLQKRFGASSEGLPGQGELFNELEEVLEPTTEEVAADQTVTYTRKKPRRPRIDESLPREEVLHDIADEDKVCDCCGHDLHRMGEEISEELEFIPATARVLRHVRPKYSCRACEKHGTQTAVKIAPVKPSILPKSIATPSLLAQIISAKFQFGLPLYRQEAMFKQYGIELSRQTMSRWMLTVSDKLRPLYQRMHDILLKQPALWADETTLNVLDVDKSKCYMWVYGCGTDKPRPDKSPNIVLYDYQDGRGGAHPAAFLADYCGPLQVDGYQGYEQTGARLAGCWAHARRKFIEAKTVQGKGKSGKADQALSFIQKLYGVEQKIKDDCPAQKQEKRTDLALPVMDKLKTWLDKSALQVNPQSLLGKAIHYTLKQWDKLQVYLHDGHVNIDNNRAERAIKPFVIGRKAWLFSNSRGGAQASAILYSMVETAKANGLMPVDYLMMLFEQLPLLDDGDDLDPLLPWQINADKNGQSN